MLILIKKIGFFLILLLIGFFFYKKVIKGENPFFSKGDKKKYNNSEGIEKMEKDPVCSTYVPIKSSLKIKHEGEVYHFCSEKCRKKYLSILNEENVVVK